MGGSAFLIYGTVSDDLLQPRAVRGSLVDRLLGRKRTAAPSWAQLGPDRRMIDLPTEQLEPMATAFREHLAQRFDPPWPATAAVLEYLALGVTHVYLRGDASGNAPPEWYVQLMFTGCAGMAETSAEVATHWAERWYDAHRTELAARYLQPHGFDPIERVEPMRQAGLFVPLGTAGYALYSPVPRDVDEEYFESRHFEIDASVTESMSDDK